MSGSLAYYIRKTVGVRQDAAASVEETLDIRDRGFTLVADIWDEIRRGLAYLRGKKSDVDSIAPSLFAGHGGHKKNQNDVQTGPAATQTAPVAATATASPNAKPQSPGTPDLPGAPRGSPFLDQFEHMPSLIHRGHRPPIEVFIAPLSTKTHPRVIATKHPRARPARRVTIGVAMKILRISHLGIACEDLSKPADMLNRLFGMTSQHTEEVAEQKVRTGFYPVGETTLEYLESTDPEGPIGKFLAKKGPGVHHVAFEVDDVDAAVQELLAKGVRMIDKAPRKGAHGNRIAFIHPAETQGVLVEICQPSGKH